MATEEPKCLGCGAISLVLENPEWFKITEVLASGTVQIYRHAGWYCERCSKQVWQHDHSDTAAFLHGFLRGKGLVCYPPVKSLASLCWEFEEIAFQAAKYGCQQEVPDDLRARLHDIKTNIELAAAVRLARNTQ